MDELTKKSNLEMVDLDEDDLDERVVKVKQPPPLPTKLSRNLAAHLIKSVPPPSVLRNSDVPESHLQPTHIEPSDVDLETLLSGLESRLLKRMDHLEQCMQNLDKKLNGLTANFQKSHESIDSPNTENK